MTFGKALIELMNKSYYLQNEKESDLYVSMKDAEEIILDLRDAYENGSLG